MVRRVLITGANKGIGLAIANRCLADHNDTHVILGCRSTSRGDAAAAELGATNPDWKERVTVLQMDTSDDDSVKNAARKVEQTFGGDPHPLFGIVNNAGIAAGSIQDVLNVNIRGPRRVDTAFIPLLDPNGGRIVQMSSGAASGCVSKSSEARKAFFTDPNVTWAQISGLIDEVEAYSNGVKDFEEKGIGIGMVGAYGLSKALLNSYTMLVARENPTLKVNSCSPGMIATDIFGGFLPWWAPVPGALLRWIATKMMNAKTPDEGTVSTMHLLFSPEIDSLPQGRYYGSDAKRSPLDTYRSPGSPPFDGP
jgi:carbonyl reductase 1